VLLILALTITYGFFKLNQNRESGRLRISVVQGNIPQSIKWQDYAKEQILEQYLSLSREVLSDNPELIIWPEAALPGVLDQDEHLKEKLEAFVGKCGVPLLAGAVYSDKGAYYNSAILISGNGEITNRYDKLHLVPFGEYIPIKTIFGFLETVVPIGDCVSGKEYTVFSLNREVAGSLSRTTEKQPQTDDRVDFSVLICFEDIFPQISRRFVKKGADFLVNITNDAWFGDTSSPYQHLQASVFRAVENRVYLVRAANTGISGFIAPHGKVYPLIDSNSGKQTFASGSQTRNIILAPKQDTFYTKLGDWFVLICLAFVTYGVIKNKK
jgi:apolipoprotein N-acyltransferase